jgi:hypothetical protein
MRGRARIREGMREEDVRGCASVCVVVRQDDTRGWASRREVMRGCERTREDVRRAKGEDVRGYVRVCEGV